MTVVDFEATFVLLPLGCFEYKAEEHRTNEELDTKQDT